MIKSVRFADDQATMVSSVEGLQDMITRMNNTAKSFCIKINTKKTKVMSPGRNLRSCWEETGTGSGKAVHLSWKYYHSRR